MLIYMLEQKRLKKSVRQYQRLMRRHQDTVHTDAEQQELLHTLRSAPGVADAEIVEIHPKGGYRTRFDLAGDQIDAFLAHMDEHDWMSVM